MASATWKVSEHSMIWCVTCRRYVFPGEYAIFDCPTDGMGRDDDQFRAIAVKCEKCARKGDAK